MHTIINLKAKKKKKSYMWSISRVYERSKAFNTLKASISSFPTKKTVNSGFNTLEMEHSSDKNHQHEAQLKNIDLQDHEPPKQHTTLKDKLKN